MNLPPDAGRVASPGGPLRHYYGGCQPQSGVPAANRTIVAEVNTVAGSPVEHAE